MVSHWIVCAIVATSAAQPALKVAVFSENVGESEATAVADATQGATVGLDGVPALDNATLLVILNGRVFPAAAVSSLVGFLDRGGHLLVLGGPAFEQLVYKTADGIWLPEPEFLASTSAERTLVDWATVDFKQLERGSSQPEASVRYVPVSGGMNAEVDIINPGGWETVAVPCVAAGVADHDVLRFRAAGTGLAASFLVELREKDGSRWMAVVPLSKDERELGIHRDQFTYWADSWSKGRGEAGDRVHFENVTAVVLGFAASHHIMTAGRQGYLIRNITTGKAPGAFARPEMPKLEGLCPAYKTYTAQPVKYESAGAAKGLDWGPPGLVVSPIARPMRTAPDREYTWQPLVKGFDDRGQWCATPVSTMWNRKGATWTFVGCQLGAAEAAAFGKRLAVTLAAGPEFEEGVGPLLEGRERGECVKVEGGEFILAGKRWFAHGINFWPLYVSGLEPVQYFSHWLEPRFYIPELVEQDLVRLKSLGITLVSIQYGKPEQAPQLRDFLARCGRHGIKANIWLNGAHPTEPAGDDDLSARPFIELLRAADLADNPNVFGYDLAWEPCLGWYDNRRKYDRLFETWVIEQYGSIEHAEKVWGYPANRVEGSLGGPTQEQLTKEGPHRVMVAAYRRFADDLISHRYREVIRLVREIDPTHLFGARTGYGGTGTMWSVGPMQYSLTAGAAHLDFISPEGWGYNPQNISDAALVSRYARWAGNGKPVFWSEFGYQVWNGGESALKQQEAMYEAFLEMVNRTGANGWAGWWYPGGYRVDERSDYGIVAPDGAFRPAARLLGKAASELKHNLQKPVMAGTLTVEPDTAPQGLAAIVTAYSKQFAEVYAKGQIFDIRTPGTDTTSANCPFTGVGGIPFEAPSPPQFLNAEVVLAARSSGRVRIQLINTGEATWLVGDCVLVVQRPDGSLDVPLPKNVGRFERVTLELDDPGAARIALRATRFGIFGERLTLGH